MKHILILFIAFLLPAVLYSCGENKGVENPDIIMEDFFITDILIPTEDFKETLEERLRLIQPTLPDDYGDSICIYIHCSANWSTSRNNDPSSVKIIEIDTSSLIYMAINEGTDKEAIFRWDRLSDRPLLRTIRTILDSGAYSFYCVDCGESLEWLMDRYYGPIASTAIDFEVCIRK